MDAFSYRRCRDRNREVWVFPEPGAGSKSHAFYKLGPDSLEQEGVPKGQIRGPFTLPSTAYPGTQHTYWVYVPAQYNSTVPASLMIFNDGQAFMAPNGNLRAHNVLDNLIYRREIPVMIGVFINPGRRPDQPEPTPQNWGDRDTNRPTEYNSLDDRYPRVIVDELMPGSIRSTTSQRILSSTALAAPVPARLQRSLWRGSGRMSFERFSALLAVSRTFAEATLTPIS